MPEIPGRLRPPRIGAAPASPALGELYYDTGTNTLYYWNGTAWTAAGSSGPKITSSAMSGGPPTSPANGDIWIATAVDANGTAWQFRYNSGSASTYKWEFIGGPPVYSAVETQESTSSGSYVDLTTVGPSFTCARGGDYLTQHSADMYNGGGTAGWGAAMSISAGGSTPSDTDALYHVVPGVIQANLNFGGKINRYPGLAASAVIKAQYRFTSGGTATFGYRRLLITPVRVS
jgi:hypothetical protein